MNIKRHPEGKTKLAGKNLLRRIISSISKWGKKKANNAEERKKLLKRLIGKNKPNGS